MEVVAQLLLFSYLWQTQFPFKFFRFLSLEKITCLTISGAVKSDVTTLILDFLSNIYTL